METKTESKEQQQWKDSISQSSSSRSSSITSESSDGHFDIRHFPLPKPSLSASEAQKQRESHQAYYNSSVSSSYTGSSISSVHQNHLADSPGYDPNRIPSSVFSSKPANSTEWSIASNESLFSIHDGNFFNISTREDHGLVAAVKLGEIPEFQGSVQEITEIKPVPLPLPLPPVKKPTEPEKDMITEKKPDHVERSDSEDDADDNDKMEEEEMTELESEDEHHEEEEDLVEDVKENKPEDTNSIVSNSPSISCRSDTSINSISSFAFPVLQKEDGVNITPSMETRGNVSHKRRPEYMRPLSPMQPAQPESLPYSESGSPTQLQPQSQPQRKASTKIKSRTPKALRKSWFSCFHFPSKCTLFK